MTLSIWSDCSSLIFQYCGSHKTDAPDRMNRSSTRFRQISSDQALPVPSLGIGGESLIRDWIASIALFAWSLNKRIANSISEALGECQVTVKSSGDVYRPQSLTETGRPSSLGVRMV